MQVAVDTADWLMQVAVGTAELVQVAVDTVMLMQIAADTLLHIPKRLTLDLFTTLLVCS